MTKPILKLKGQLMLLGMVWVTAQLRKVLLLSIPKIESLEQTKRFKTFKYTNQNCSSTIKYVGKVGWPRGALDKTQH